MSPDPPVIDSFLKPFEHSRDYKMTSDALEQNPLANFKNKFFEISVSILSAINKVSTTAVNFVQAPINIASEVISKGVLRASDVGIIDTKVNSIWTGRFGPRHLALKIEQAIMGGTSYGEIKLTSFAKLFDSSEKIHEYLLNPESIQDAKLQGIITQATKGKEDKFVAIQNLVNQINSAKGKAKPTTELCLKYGGLTKNSLKEAVKQGVFLGSLTAAIPLVFAQIGGYPVYNAIRGVSIVTNRDSTKKILDGLKTSSLTQKATMIGSLGLGVAVEEIMGPATMYLDNFVRGFSTAGMRDEDIRKHLQSSDTWVASLLQAYTFGLGIKMIANTGLNLAHVVPELTSEVLELFDQQPFPQDNTEIHLAQLKNEEEGGIIFKVRERFLLLKGDPTDSTLVELVQTVDGEILRIPSLEISEEGIKLGRIVELANGNHGGIEVGVIFGNEELKIGDQASPLPSPVGDGDSYVEMLGDLPTDGERPSPIPTSPEERAEMWSNDSSTRYVERIDAVRELVLDILPNATVDPTVINSNVLNEVTADDFRVVAANLTVEFIDFYGGDIELALNNLQVGDGRLLNPGEAHQLAVLFQHGATVERIIDAQGVKPEISSEIKNSPIAETQTPFNQKDEREIKNLEPEMEENNESELPTKSEESEGSAALSADYVYTTEQLEQAGFTMVNDLGLSELLAEVRRDTGSDLHVYPIREQDGQTLSHNYRVILNEVRDALGNQDITERTIPRGVAVDFDVDSSGQIIDNSIHVRIAANSQAHEQYLHGSKTFYQDNITPPTPVPQASSIEPEAEAFESFVPPIPITQQRALDFTMIGDEGSSVQDVNAIFENEAINKWREGSFTTPSMGLQEGTPSGYWERSNAATITANLYNSMVLNGEDDFVQTYFPNLARFDQQQMAQQIANDAGYAFQVSEAVAFQALQEAPQLYNRNPMDAQEIDIALMSLRVDIGQGREVINVNNAPYKISEIIVNHYNELVVTEISSTPTPQPPREQQPTPSAPETATVSDEVSVTFSNNITYTIDTVNNLVYDQNHSFLGDYLDLDGNDLDSNFYYINKDQVFYADPNSSGPRIWGTYDIITRSITLTDELVPIVYN